MSEVDKKSFRIKDVCCYCNCKLDNFNRTVEHLTPKSKGGILSNDNKRYACHDCNHLKKNMTPEEFLASLRMLYHETVRLFGRNVNRYKAMIKNLEVITKEREQREKPHTGGD